MSGGEVAGVAEGLVVKPGDSLIVRVATGTTPKQIDEFLNEIQGRFPDVEVTVVGAEQIAVVRRG